MGESRRARPAYPVRQSPNRAHGQRRHHLGCHRGVLWAQTRQRVAYPAERRRRPWLSSDREEVGGYGDHAAKRLGELRDLPSSSDVVARAISGSAPIVNEELHKQVEPDEQRAREIWAVARVRGWLARSPVVIGVEPKLSRAPLHRHFAGTALLGQRVHSGTRAES